MRINNKCKVIAVANQKGGVSKTISTVNVGIGLAKRGYKVLLIDAGLIHNNEGVDLIPGNIELSAMEIVLVNAMRREYVLDRFISSVKEYYDYIITDCMPFLGMVTINVLTCDDSVLIPVEAAYLPIKGLQQLIKTIGKVMRTIFLHEKNRSYAACRD